MNQIQRIEPPALPLPTEKYTRYMADQHNNVLRLYFNRLTELMGQLLSPDSGGKYLYVPTGNFYDTTIQTAAATGTAYVITFNTTNFGNDVSVVSNSRINVIWPGYYLFSFYGHLDTTGAAGDITIWAKVNGVNTDTARRVNVTSDLPIQFSSVLKLNAEEYVEFFWETDNTNTQLAAVAAGANYPAIPSVAVSVSYVSNG